MEQGSRTPDLYGQLVEKAAEDIRERGTAEVELGEKELATLMQEGIRQVLQTEKAQKIGLKVEVTKNEIAWRDNGVGYSGQISLSLGRGEPLSLLINCSFDNGPDSSPMLRLSEQPGPIISFENLDEALKASSLFTIAGTDLRAVNEGAKRVLSNPSSFLFTAIKEMLQPSNMTKQAPLDRGIQLDPESVMAFITPSKTLKIRVSRK